MLGRDAFRFGDVSNLQIKLRVPMFHDPDQDDARLTIRQSAVA